jgi:hypothetical protein
MNLNLDHLFLKISNDAFTVLMILSKYYKLIDVA